jgi:hypothetical protein
MSNSGGKITAPVSIDDVRTVLGLSNYNLGYLCGNTHGKINQWARYKPVRYNSMTATDVWKGTNGLCGYDIYISSSVQSVVDRIMVRNNNWNYLPPTGGDAAPYRLLDFDKYDNNCVKPINLLQDKNIAVNSTNQWTSIVGNQNAYTNDRNFRISDLTINGTSVANCYFCVVFVRPEDGKLIAGSCSQYPIGTAYNNSVITSASNPWRTPITSGLGDIFNTGDGYRMCCLISTVKRAAWVTFSKGESWSGGGYYADTPIYDASFSIFGYKDYGIYVEAYYTTSNATRNGIEFEVFGNNTTSSSVDLGSIQLDLYQYDERGDDEYGFLAMPKIAYSPSVIIPANSKDYETRIGGSLSSNQIAGWHKDNIYYIKTTGSSSMVGSFYTRVYDR